MHGSYRKILGRLGVAAVLVSMTSGCKFFDIGNPFLPEARLMAQAKPTMIEVAYTYRLSDNTMQASPTDVKIHVAAFPRDATPGVMINAFSAEYFDMTGQSIPSMFLAKSNFALSQYVPPSTASQAASVDLDLPIYSQQVRLYGEKLAYSFAGGVSLNPNFSHVITCRVTLYGQDDNYNQVKIPVDVPIRFKADIQQ